MKEGTLKALFPLPLRRFSPLLSLSSASHLFPSFSRYEPYSFPYRITTIPYTTVSFLGTANVLDFSSFFQLYMAAQFPAHGQVKEFVYPGGHRPVRWLLEDPLWDEIRVLRDRSRYRVGVFRARREDGGRYCRRHIAVIKVYQQ